MVTSVLMTGKLSSPLSLEAMCQSQNLYYWLESSSQKTNSSGFFMSCDLWLPSRSKIRCVMQDISHWMYHLAWHFTGLWTIFWVQHSRYSLSCIRPEKILEAENVQKFIVGYVKPVSNVRFLRKFNCPIFPKISILESASSANISCDRPLTPYCRP